MQKHFKALLRLWFTTSSVIGFFTGWALLAHSGKPIAVSADQSAAALAATPFPPLPTLAPVPGMNDPNAGLQPLPVIPRSKVTDPRLGTGGS